MVSVKDFGAVGDGIANDGAAIQSAINSGAGDIFFPDGTYKIGDTILQPQSGQTFRGNPGKSIIAKATTATFRTKPFFLVKDVEDVTFDGLIFDLDLSGSNTKQFGIHIQATALGDTQRITVKNCVLNQTYCFAERYTAFIRMQNCKVYANGLSSGGLSTGAVVSLVNGTRTNTNGLCQHIWIEDCYFEQTFGEALDINWHTRNVTVRGCHFRNCATDGSNEVIDIGSDASADDTYNCQNITLADLLITNSGNMTASAILIKGKTKAVKMSNIVIRADGATPGTLGAGIKIWDSPDIQIDGLTVEGFAYGVYTQKEGASYPSNIKVKSFHISRYGVEGLQIEATKSHFGPGSIDGAGSTSYGIDLVLATKSTYSHIQIANAAVSGIRLQGGTIDNLFQGLDIEASASHGISAAAGCDRNRFLGNALRNNIGTSLNFATSDRNVVQGNICTGNGTNAPATGSLTNSSVADNLTT